MRACRTAVVALSVGAVLATSLTGPPVASADSTTSTSTSAVSTKRLTNLAHLDFLLDTAPVRAVSGHTTYRATAEPELTLPWTYADARDGGTFARVGGGTLDPATGHYGQGAFNTDDVARAAVVYLRDWRQTKDPASRDKAYELLRSVAYLQTTTGANAGRSVLWMQSDGTLNPSAEPKELPDPSDSGPSYWQARTLWAYGEGYAAFRHSDPAFAAFLAGRLQLSVKALNRDVLNKYGRYRVADGVRVPAWLIADGADVSAEAVLGLSSYVAAAPRDRLAHRALSQLADGVAELGRAGSAGAAGSNGEWPYGALLPWAESRSMWHAWSSQMSVGLARASVTLHRPGLLRPALRETTRFDPTLLTWTGPVNALYPTPVDLTQIAYGADSRLQSLLAVADASKAPGPRALAGIAAGWYFGANPQGVATYDPATGVTVDGLNADGTLNRNSGAESTIHGLLSMLALDAHPDVAAAAQRVRSVVSRDGGCVLQAEDATRTDGTVVKPDSLWTGESQYGGTGYLQLAPGQTARLTGCATPGQPRTVEPVSLLAENGRAVSTWTDGQGRRLGRITHRVGAQGITAVPGALLPRTLAKTTRSGSVEVRASRGTVSLDAVISRPLIATGVYDGPDGSVTLLQATTSRARTASAPAGVLDVYDDHGRRVLHQVSTKASSVRVPGFGFAVVQPR